MRKLLTLVVLLCVFSVSTFSQPDCGGNSQGIRHITKMTRYYPMNTISGTFQPVDLGYGIRYDRRIVNPIGLYVCGSAGYYWVPGTDLRIDHLKLAGGFNWYLPPIDIMQNALSVGVSYHDFNNSIPDDMRDYVETVSTRNRFKNWSFELGCSMRIGRFLTSGFRFDFYRNESNVDVGISF